MQVFVLIANDKTIEGIYSTKAQLITALTTDLAATAIKNIEVWDIDNGFIEYLNINKQTTISIVD